MKTLIITLILLQTLFMFGQKKLDGTFCSKVKYSSSSCYTFKSDSLFNYSSNGCKTTEKGRGKYKIIENTLNLTFLETDTANNSAVIQKNNCEYSDSVTLTFYITALETKLPISYADIWFSKDEKISSYYHTNEGGNLIIQIPKSKIQSELNFNIKIAMHKQMTFKVNTSFCSKISVVLETSDVSYQENGTIWNYKILKHSNDKLVLKGKNNYRYKYKKSSHLNTY